MITSMRDMSDRRNELGLKWHDNSNKSRVEGLVELMNNTKKLRCISIKILHLYDQWS